MRPILSLFVQRTNANIHCIFWYVKFYNWPLCGDSRGGNSAKAPVMLINYPARCVA